MLRLQPGLTSEPSYLNMTVLRTYTLAVVWLILILFLVNHFLDHKSTLPHHTPSAPEVRLRTKTRILTSVVQGRNRTSPRSLRPVQVAEEKQKRNDHRPNDRSKNFSQTWSSKVLEKLWTGNLTVGMLSPHLKNIRRSYLNSTKHEVVYPVLRTVHRSKVQLYCDMKSRTKVRTVDGTEEPFSSLGWDQLVPLQTVQDLHYQKCAVVMSAGSMLRSALGREIDSHDAVLRFNAAPTVGFETDVGNKTTIRIINSQIVSKRKHQFSSSPLYEGVTLLVWDPASYSLNLTKWFQKPDFNLFSAYERRRIQRPEQPFYVLHPQFIWTLWDLIQNNTEDQIQPNPPSSGFMGILLMMSLCRDVSVYEFLPSTRHTSRCHYYERNFDSACTFGAYHPLLYEKLLVQRLNEGNVDELRTKGKVRLRGFSAVQCET
ncbi:beta-galactoside alpha-2,6-sialyltransferase 2-like isoform X1 [Mastacembelus armatus]|uniref:beta-galactoside alpha-2,6-sialyltransferase 2-like isoform X1 n=1 Tax=Mastacembelus armatus TaxID=205130 RepID=UPI000E454EAC|nr:beta-galactoside alpha-2,6-sialyltransferase 2-like isoform X1 [Mastacembelus armatus]